MKYINLLNAKIAFVIVAITRNTPTTVDPFIDLFKRPMQIKLASDTFIQTVLFSRSQRVLFQNLCMLLLFVTNHFNVIIKLDQEGSDFHGNKLNH